MGSLKTVSIHIFRSVWLWKNFENQSTFGKLWARVGCPVFLTDGVKALEHVKQFVLTESTCPMALNLRHWNYNVGTLPYFSYWKPCWMWLARCNEKLSWCWEACEMRYHPEGGKVSATGWPQYHPIICRGSINVSAGRRVVHIFRLKISKSTWVTIIH